MGRLTGIPTMGSSRVRTRISKGLPTPRPVVNWLSISSGHGRVYCQLMLVKQYPARPGHTGGSTIPNRLAVWSIFGVPYSAKEGHMWVGEMFVIDMNGMPLWYPFLHWVLEPRLQHDPFFNMIKFIWNFNMIPFGVFVGLESNHATLNPKAMPVMQMWIQPDASGRGAVECLRPEEGKIETTRLLHSGKLAWKVNQL